MKLDMTEKLLARIVAFGGALTTIFLISGQVTDPVNAPKLLILGITSASSITLVLVSNLRERLKEHRLAVALILLFILQMFVSTFSSDSPFSQNLYGSYGRNNGLLTYFFLGLIFCSILCLHTKYSVNLIIKSFVWAGAINLVYNFWVIAFGDFVGWDNPYGNILGTLGNPNFIGAFLGMFFSMLLAFSLDSDRKRLNRVFSVFGLILCFYEIIKSHAIQGIVVAVFGSGIVLFIYFRSKFSNSFLFIYSLLSGILAIFALAGALQKGTFTDFVYKTSVSLRGQYWLAGWNTGNSNPLTGA